MNYEQACKFIDKLSRAYDKCISTFLDASPITFGEAWIIIKKEDERLREALVKIMNQPYAEEQSEIARKALECERQSSKEINSREKLQPFGLSEVVNPKEFTNKDDIFGEK